MIPGSGRSPGETIGYPLQYSWASIVAQLVKNPPATWETWVRYLGWEDLLKKGKANHSSILVWRIPWTIILAHTVAKSRTRLNDFHSLKQYNKGIDAPSALQVLRIERLGQGKLHRRSDNKLGI